jgi:hypothetical protein
MRRRVRNPLAHHCVLPGSRVTDLTYLARRVLAHKRYDFPHERLFILSKSIGSRRLTRHKRELAKSEETVPNARTASRWDQIMLRLRAS